jgi:DNA-binding transcriptional ArsR family regulator
MDGAVWLFLYLLLHAERRSGLVRVRIATVAERMGAPQRTVQRWLRRLLAHGYVDLREEGKVLGVVISRWRATASRAGNGVGRAIFGAESRHLWRGFDPGASGIGRHLRDDQAADASATKSL